MILQCLEPVFCVCKIEAFPPDLWRTPYVFAAQTGEECSLVCPQEDVPAHTLAAEPGWRGLKVQGPLDFSLIGILAKLTAVLADAQVSVFAVSTFDTDYLFIRLPQWQTALDALQKEGYRLA